MERVREEISDEELLEATEGVRARACATSAALACSAHPGTETTAGADGSNAPQFVPLVAGGDDEDDAFDLDHDLENAADDYGDAAFDDCEFGVDGENEDEHTTTARPMVNALLQTLLAV